MPIGFPSDKELRKHTRRHWSEFGLAHAADYNGYLGLAQAFCDGPCPADAEECVRVRDAKIDRFRELTAEFAVLMSDRSFILTFHILHPLGTIGVPVEHTHSYGTNREYYEVDCGCMP